MSDTHEAPPVLDLKANLKRPLKAAVIAGMITVIVSVFMPNYYKSEARLLPVDTSASGGLGGLAAAAAAFGVNIGGGGGSDANFVDILKSRWLKENLLATRFQFQDRPWRFGARGSRQETLSQYLGQKNLDRAVKKLDKYLSANKDIKSNIITLSAETTSPELSQEMVHRATELLNQFVVNNSRTHGSEKATFAKARLADARKQMDQAEVAFREFLETNRNYEGSSDPAVRLRGAQLEAELNLRRQLVNTLAMNLEQAMLDAKNDVPILNVLDSGNLPLEKSRPHRAMMAAIAALLVGILVLGWDNRQKISAFLNDSSALEE